MQPEQLEALQGMVNQSAQALFTSYGFACRDAPAPAPVNELATALGFSASELSGSLSLSTSKDVAITLVEGTPGATGIEDWLGELTNQLFGRLQRRLLWHGVALSGGLPVVVRGDRLNVLDHMPAKAPEVPNRERVCVDHAIHVGGGTVLVRVTLELDEQFTLLSAGAAVDESAGEDEPILF